MKALTAVRPGEAKFKEVEKPVATGNMLLVKVCRAGICATDFSIFSGESSFVKNGQIKYPVRFGHEWSGTVESVGEDVKKFKKGDRVVSDSGISCGKCEACKSGNYGECANIRSVGTINAWDGCFGEYMLVPEFNAYHIPENVSFDEAALIEPAAISYDAFDGIEIRDDMTVVVVGIGAIGMSAIWLAKYFGAKKVIAIGRNDCKLKIAGQIGADILVNNTEVDAVETVLKETDGNGADFVIETSGSESALIDAVSMTKQDGRVSIISFYEKPINGFPMDDVAIKCITLKGAAGRYGNPPKISKIMSEYDKKLVPIITHRVAFDDCLDVFNNERKYCKDKIKIMVEFD